MVAEARRIYNKTLIPRWSAVVHFHWTQIWNINPAFTAIFLTAQIKYKIGKNVNSVQQQCEHHHQKVLIKSFHLSGYTSRFCWTVQDLEV